MCGKIFFLGFLAHLLFFPKTNKDLSGCGIECTLFSVHHRDTDVLKRSLTIPDVLLHNSRERQNTPLNLKICRFYATGETRVNKKKSCWCQVHCGCF